MLVNQQTKEIITAILGGFATIITAGTPILVAWINKKVQKNTEQNANIQAKVDDIHEILKDRDQLVQELRDLKLELAKYKPSEDKKC